MFLVGDDVRHASGTHEFFAGAMLLKKSFYLASLFLFLTLSINAVQKPNVLWIYLEDTSTYFSCYGDKYNQGKTPHVDKLAAEELYDLRNDVHQMNNLALLDEYQYILIKHRIAQNDWIIETDDKGQYPESAEELKAQLKKFKKQCVNPEYTPYK